MNKTICQIFRDLTVRGGAIRELLTNLHLMKEEEPAFSYTTLLSLEERFFKKIQSTNSAVDLPLSLTLATAPPQKD